MSDAGSRKPRKVRTFLRGMTSETYGLLGYDAVHVFEPASSATA